MEPIYQSLTNRALALCAQLEHETPAQKRIIVILAGPPGSGKSTIAEQVIQRLNETYAIPFAASLPMDGFHLSRSALDALPNSKEAYLRRGAAWTFDSNGVLELVGALSISRFTPSGVIVAPSFDHAVKDPVTDGVRITSDVKFILLEGNYLLLDEEPWRHIVDMVDDAWFVDVDAELAKARIAKRHIESGIENTWEAAERRAESNDLLNGVEIRKKLVRPAVVVQSVEE